MNKQIKKHRLQGKTASHTKLLSRGLVMELLRVGQIKTTPAKAKIIKSKFDRLVTLAKKGESSNGQLQSFFDSNAKAIAKFNKVVESQLQDRNSGYTSIVKTLPRKGDNAAQVYISIVNNQVKEKKSEVQKMLEKREKESKSKAKKPATKKVTKAKEDKN